MPKEARKTPIKRKIISLETKIKILDRLAIGERPTEVANSYGLNEATVRTIRKNESSIRKSVAAGTDTSKATTSYVRDNAMESMEKALMIWIEDQNQKRMPVDTNAITHKAKRIYEKIKEQLPSTSSSSDTQKPTFVASHGWFERFKQRHSLHNLKMKGEQASGDERAAREYSAKLTEIITENSYVPDQVFNADETGLFWKKMPNRTYVAKSQKRAGGHKAAKDRITILFCSNASGDHIMKPLVINKSLTPRAFKGINMDNLPVHWMANKKAWVTASIFNEWFQKCFIPDAKRYLAEKMLPFKVLLLIDNAPGHPKDLTYENVQVRFLPPNTTSLIQPLDQGIISTFKALYIKQTFSYILEQMEHDESLTVVDAWKSFTILDCVKHVALAYSEIKKSTLNACWKPIWPQVVGSATSVEPLEEELYSQIVEMAHLVRGEGFEELVEADIIELAANQDLDDDDLVGLVNEQNHSDSDTGEEEEPVAFTTKVVREGLQLGRKLGNYFLQNDPNVERALRFQRDINRYLAQYEEVYKDLNKNKVQPLITDFMLKTHRPVMVPNPLTIEPETPQEISSDESEIAPIRKKRLIIDTDDSN